MVQPEIRNNLSLYHLRQLQKWYYSLPTVMPELHSGEVARYHDRLSEVIDSLVQEECPGNQLDVFASYGALIKTQQYLRGNNIKSIYRGIFVSDSIYSPNYILEKFKLEDDEDQEQHIINIVIAANALDSALHNPDTQQKVIEEMNIWSSEDISLVEKLGKCPVIERIILDTAVSLHEKNPLRMPGSNNGWSKTTEESRTISYVIAASVVNSLVSIATSESPDTMNTIAPPTITEITQLHQIDKLSSDEQSEQSQLFDSAVQSIGLRFDVLSYREKFIRYWYMTLKSKLTPVSPEERSRYEKYCDLSKHTIQHLPLQDWVSLTAHQEWLGSNNSQPKIYLDYPSGDLLVEIRPEEVTPSMRESGRIRNIFLRPDEKLDSTRAFHAVVHYIHARIIPILRKNHLQDGKESLSNFLQSLILDYQIHGDSYDCNPVLEQICSLVHDSWIIDTYQEERESARRERRRSDIRLYTDLTNKEKSLYRRAVHNALLPITAAFMKTLKLRSLRARYVPELEFMLKPLVHSAEVLKTP